MSKIIVPLHFAKLNSTPANVETGFKKFYLRGEWFKLYNGITEIDVVLDRPLDNYIPIPGIITASDTVLTAIEKLDYAIGNINPNVLWGSITGNILAQTDLIAYIAALPASPLSALPFTTDHLAATNNQYVIGDLVWYLGNVYRCIASNDSIIPTSTLYWTSLGAGYPLVQQPADWNSTSGNNQILNKPTIPTTPNLQQVTTVGAITSDAITVAGIYSGNLYSDGFSFGISDGYDANYNLLYTPYSGLQITDTINSVSIYQDASIGFQTAAGYGNLRSDLVTGSQGWQLPNASGTLALFSDIPTVGTWGALNYPTWTAGTPFVKMTGVGTFALDTNTYLTTTAAALTYFPIPTGTISQYIRGDGSLATFPSTAIPTLQQVVTAGNIITTPFTHTSTGFENTFNASSINIIDKNIPGLNSGIFYQVNGLYRTYAGLTQSLVFAPFDGLAPPNRTITIPNATGTMALLSDIPSGGVTSVGLTMPSAFTVTNSPITSSGDIAVTGAGTVNQYVRGDGTLANFPNSTGGGSSVNYYLNGSVSQGTFGGDTYYQLSKTPILGAGTNFTRTNGAGNGYIASFITDAGDPSQLNIPGGNWNVEFYFNASSGGGSPSFYAELYKVSAANVFTLIASDSLNPEGITNGTTVDQYFTSIPVPQTTLLVTDRLAVRIFVNTGGRTITLHTENGNLSEVLTTFTTGLTALNGLTQQVQFFNVGTGATNFNISSSGDTHTFNLLFNIRRNANNSSNNNINYCGYAPDGSAESSAVWTITRLTISASGAITIATATNVAWTNRESATYI